MLGVPFFNLVFVWIVGAQREGGYCQWDYQGNTEDREG